MQSLRNNKSTKKHLSPGTLVTQRRIYSVIFLFKNYQRKIGDIILLDKILWLVHRNRCTL